jgi:hypothetical protein
MLAVVSWIDTTLNVVLIKMISSGIDTFFIQNIRSQGNENKNNIPFFIGRDERYISPVVFSANVRATSQVRTIDGFPVG